MGQPAQIAEQGKLERRVQSAERLSTLGRFAAGLAHEIANPLTCVLANVGAVREELSALEARVDAETAATLRLLGDLLAEASSGTEQAGRTAQRIVRFLGGDERPRLVDLPNVIDGAARMAHNQLRHQAHVQLDYGATPYVEANEEDLTHAFASLLANAVEALAPDSEHNRIRVRTYTDRAGRAVAEVHDNGRVIPADEGAGVAICRRVVTTFGGDIAVARDASGGTVRVTLPPARPMPVPTITPAPRGRVLVIDDDAAVARALARTLNREHDVIVETDPHVALARIARAERFDVVMCDLMMPEMNGRAVYETIAVANRALLSRVVFLTGGVFTRDMEQFLASVKNPVLTKPFDAHALRELIASLLAAR